MIDEVRGGWMIICYKKEEKKSNQTTKWYITEKDSFKKKGGVLV